MSEFKVIIQPTDPITAKSELQSWLDRNNQIRDQLGEQDLIIDVVLADGRQIKHQYRIRQSLLESRSTHSC